MTVPGTESETAWEPWLDSQYGREVFRQHGETGRIQEMNAAYANALEAEARAGRLAQAALTALAKVQYDGTIAGLREQMRVEDWGNILPAAVEETKAAYELILVALAVLDNLK